MGHSKPLNILTLNYEFPPVGGGASPVSYQLCRELVSKGHNVDVVTMRYKNTPRFEVVDGIRIHRTPALRAREDICRTHEMATYLPGALRTVVDLLRKGKHDIIHCHFIIPTSPLAWLASKSSGVPYLVTCHGSDVPGHNPDRFKLMHSLIRPGWRFLARQCPQLVSPSGALRDEILHHAPDVNVKLIPNGIHLDAFKSGPKEKRILLCSRLLPMKGFQFALEAIKELKLDWPIDIVGEGPYLTDLKRIATHIKGEVTFYGWLDHKSHMFRELYEKCSVFIFPAESENFPTVLLEAMAAGMAIITSDAGGCPEVVGDAALFVKPRDTSSIMTQLRRLTTEDGLIDSLSQQARQRVKQFMWPSVVDQYLDVYRDVIRSAGR